jgi:hypothetical protein
MIAYFNKIYIYSIYFLYVALEEKAAKLLLITFAHRSYWYLFLSTGSQAKIYNNRRRLFSSNRQQQRVLNDL